MTNAGNTPPATDVYFGLVFELQGETGKKEIVLEPKTAINNIQKYGIECELPSRVSLGTVGSNLDSLLKTIGYKEGKQPVDTAVTNLNISAVDRLYNKLINAYLNVEQFHLKIPGQEQKTAGAVTQYTIGVSATWPENLAEPGSEADSDLPGTITLRGIYLTVSNEMPPPLPEAVDEKPPEDKPNEDGGG